MLLCSTALIGLLGALTPTTQALAQTFTVPNGGSFSGTVPPNPSDGDTINLQGAAAAGDVAVTLPTGANGLTINGAAGGSTVTINSGAFGTNSLSLFTNNTSDPVTLNLIGGPITFTGANIGDAGGVLSSGATVTINGALTGKGNSASTGGMLDAASGNIVQDKGDVILGGPNAADGNQATSGNGGAIFAANGSVNLAATSGNVTLANNSASLNGGAIWASRTVTIGNANGTTTLTGNAASGSGGAIFALNAGNVQTAISITGALTSNGNTALQGGVLRANAGDIVQDGGNVVMGTTDANKATNGSGGAIFADGSVSLAATSGNVTLANNAATFNGGAIFANRTITIGNAGGTTTLTNNGASQFGGAIYALNGSNAQAAISVTGNLTANGNTGAFGGALYAFSGSVVQDFGDVRIGDTTANKATAGSGGAIFANSGSVSLAATAGSVSLVNNSATFDGGAIAALGDVTIGNTGGALVLSHNSAGQNGGAIWSGSNVTLWGTDISDNTAAGNGGAIYAAGDYTLNATTNDTIANNSAGLLGGAIWAGGNVALNATGGDIIFFGNKQNTTGTAQANAIYLDNSAAAPATLTLNTAGHVIDFADPVLSNAANGPISVTATGGGAVGFEGTLYTTQADRWSKIYGNTTVDGGTTFIVAGNAIYGALASDVGQAGPTSFTANSGALIVVGTGGEVRADSLAVNNDSRLIGDGTVTGATIAINAGGTLMPGFGTPGAAMTINGNLALNVGSTYQVQLNPTTAALANVNGTADLTGGTVNAVYANGGYISKQYTILTTTGGLGRTTFAGLTNTNLPANFHDSLSYDANSAYLDLALNFLPGPDYGSGLNTNQQNVADSLTGYFDRNNGIPSVYGTLSPDGLSQASGEVATGAQQTTFDAMGVFLGVMTDPFMNQSCDDSGTSGVSCIQRQGSQVSAYAPAPKKRSADAFAKFDNNARPANFGQRWRVWGSAFGGSQTTSGNAMAGSNNARSAVYGVAVGADYPFSPDTLAGFALAGGGTNFSVNGMGTGRSDLFQAGVYLRHTEGAAYVSAALAYGWQDITTDRTALGESLRANFNANAFSGRLEGGYRFATGWGLGLTPYAAVQVTSLNLPGYSEQMVGGGAGAFGLDYTGKTATDTRSELGLRTDKSFAVENGTLTLRGRLAWAYDFNPDRATAATFQALSGASFVVNGAARASDSALVGASAEMAWGNGWSVGATFDGEFSNVTKSYAGKGAIRFRW